MNIEQTEKNLSSIKERYQEEGKAEIQNTLQLFFKEFPEIKKIAWTQFTPYFNDGDECVFSVNDIMFLNDEYEIGDKATGYDWRGNLVENLEIGSMYDFDEVCMSHCKTNSPELQEGIKQLKSLMNTHEDILKELFGDHVEVHITADSVRIDDYDHE